MPFKTQGSFRVDRSVVSSSSIEKLLFGLKTTEEDDLNAGLNWHKVADKYFDLLFLNAYKTYGHLQ